MNADEWNAKLIEQQANPDPLDPELVPYVEDDGPLGQMIRHPLVYSMLHAPAMNWHVNQSLKAKKEAVKQALAEERWHSYIYLHERPYRVGALLDIADEVDDATYWELVGSVWIDSENIWQNEDAWDEVLHADREERDRVMDDEDRACLAMLPDEFPIYRGFSVEGREDGLSWTTDKIRAKWFGKRFAELHDGAYLASGVVSKSDVIAHFMGRGESEIVVLPERVRDLTVTELC